MSKTILIEPEAEADLRDAYLWYDDRNQGLGREFLLCFEAELAKIAEHPGAFPIVQKHTRRALTRRFPYSILFVELSDLIAIVGVFHTSRSPREWRGRTR